MTIKSVLLGASALATAATIGLTPLATANAATTAEPTIVSVNTTFHSDNKGLTIYTDPNGSQNSGKQLPTTISDWRVTREAKDANGQVIAYDLGNGQWVKAADVTQNQGTSNQTTNNNITVKDVSLTVNSNYKNVQVYSDSATTQPTDKLSTVFNLWKVFRVAYDSNGKAVAYQVGLTSWVKATDVTVN
ncbi:hypothetical protein FC83_GL002769 [Agrilactobacillus composti DSM 18527 = JCM 14202]|uniref:Surface layer protein A domain-containing protein n=1 Tax=Agrilactobacillus composti DSM 18527 = JCM 14202 TaxID=1423734 RepID=X0PHK8_9LACO|nr:hypothetical protein [Agrilactobacillus composti]KRM33519.1 hypothetical protein FC83_GL002769 [Agrilactobacillus composti DSM 18527 = JCM 14202]GAF41478.1 hypothetical protein JCM14202_3420 [Agrilactobacillus composti DSM 18527 = JCM 14202]